MVADGQAGDGAVRPQDGFDAAHERWSVAQADAKAWWSAQAAWVDRAFSEQQMNELRPVDAWRRAIMMATVHRSDSQDADRALFTSPTVTAVALAYAEYCAPELDPGDDPPSARRLALDVGCTHRAVADAFAQLESAGFLEGEVDPPERGRAKWRRLTLPAEVKVVGGDGAPTYGVRLERVGHFQTQPKGVD